MYDTRVFTRDKPQLLTEDEMAALNEMVARLAKLNLQIADIQSKGRADGIEAIKTLMAEHRLTVADITGTRAKGAKTGATKGGKVAAKYRSSATGDSWSGRGLQPRWLKAAIAAGKSIEEFSV